MAALTRRNIGIAVGMLTAVALTAGALISLSADASPAIEPVRVAPAPSGTIESIGSARVFDTVGSPAPVLPEQGWHR